MSADCQTGELCSFGACEPLTANDATNRTSDCVQKSLSTGDVLVCAGQRTYAEGARTARRSGGVLPQDADCREGHPSVCQMP